jgi:poly(3-hydroxybutyrate) depolymerase
MATTRGRLLPGTLLAALAVFPALVAAVADPLSLARLPADWRLDLDPETVTVSGLSSGGWMAHQLHVVHSASIAGAGILAAGPYQCAGGRSLLCSTAGFWLPAGSCQATVVCTAIMRQSFGGWGVYLGPPDLAPLLQTTHRRADEGAIDPLDGLGGDRVWLFTGADDAFAPAEVMAVLRDYYRTLLIEIGSDASPRSLAFVDSVDVAHAMVIDVPGPAADNTCRDQGLPHINDCDYAAASEMLGFLYAPVRPDDPPPVRPAAAAWQAGSLYAFDQRPFFDTADDSVSLHATGHLFVPQACRDGRRCRLHIALHGCRQSQDVVEKECLGRTRCRPLLFFRDAGYNEWAEANATVILYPQATVWGGAADVARNPQGCWDWWGYSGADYDTKSGKQIRAIMAMIGPLTGRP